MTPMRIITTETRRKLENIISRLNSYEEVSLTERIELSKYSKHMPFIAGKLNQALKKRNSDEKH